MKLTTETSVLVVARGIEDRSVVFESQGALEVLVYGRIAGLYARRPDPGAAVLLLIKSSRRRRGGKTRRWRYGCVLGRGT